MFTHHLPEFVVHTIWIRNKDNNVVYQTGFYWNHILPWLNIGVLSNNCKQHENYIRSLNNCKENYLSDSKNTSMRKYNVAHASIKTKRPTSYFIPTWCIIDSLCIFTKYLSRSSLCIVDCGSEEVLLLLLVIR